MKSVENNDKEPELIKKWKKTLPERYFENVKSEGFA